jgi:hypothetical protein
VEIEDHDPLVFSLMNIEVVVVKHESPYKFALQSIRL